MIRVHECIHDITVHVLRPINTTATMLSFELELLYFLLVINLYIEALRATVRYQHKYKWMTVWSLRAVEKMSSTGMNTHQCL